MDNRKEFLISVADTMGFDPDTDELLFKAKTLVNSSLKQSVSNKELRGGFGHALQYEYQYNKLVESDIEDCQFRESFISLVNDSAIQTEIGDFFVYDEEVEITSGSGVLKETPVGKVLVETDNGDIVLTITPTGKNISVPVEDGSLVTCTYQYKTDFDSILIDANKFGKTIKLVQVAKIFRQEGFFKQLVIEIPRFKISGNIEINLTSDGSTNTKLSGKALEFGNGHYAKIKIKKMDGSVIPIQQIAATKSEIALDSTTHSSEEIGDIVGIRGGQYGNINIPFSDLTITSANTGVCTINSTTQKIEYAGAGDTIVTVALTSNPSIKDVIYVECT